MWNTNQVLAHTATSYLIYVSGQSDVLGIGRGSPSLVPSLGEI